MSPKKVLINKLKGAKRIAFLGIGSEIRGDDAAGLVLAKKIGSFIKKNKIRSVKVFLGQTAPENLTGEIRKFKPTHVVMLDAVNFEAAPGKICILTSYTEASASFSTHKIPVCLMQDYLQKTCNCTSIIIGIQPQSCLYCQDLSKKINLSVDKLSLEIVSALKSLGF